METLLALETSSAVLSLAVQNSGGRQYSKSFKGPHNHAEKIIPFIDELFKKSKTSLKKTSVFLTGRGPGSFTGLRVGFYDCHDGRRGPVVFDNGLTDFF